MKKWTVRDFYQHRLSIAEPPKAVLHTMGDEHVLHSLHYGYASTADCKLTAETEPVIKMYWLKESPKVSLVNFQNAVSLISSYTYL